MKRVLFVCLGNICRSPLAEGLLRLRADQAGLELEVDSAGTGSWHNGEPPDARATVAGREHGIEIGDLRARKFGAVDFAEWDLILASDGETLGNVLRLGKSGQKAQVGLLTDYIADDALKGSNIPDPYYTGQFDPVIALIDGCIAGLIVYLKEEQDRSAAEA